MFVWANCVDHFCGVEQIAYAQCTNPLIATGGACSGLVGEAQLICMNDACIDDFVAFNLCNLYTCEGFGNFFYF